MKRIVAHFVFGFSLAGSIGNISLDWTGGQYWVFTLLFCLLICGLAEALQSSWNEKVFKDNRDLFQWPDFFKNFGGSVIGTFALYQLKGLFWISISILLVILIYAAVRVKQNKPI